MFYSISVPTRAYRDYTCMLSCSAFACAALEHFICQRGRFNDFNDLNHHQNEPKVEIRHSALCHGSRSVSSTNGIVGVLVESMCKHNKQKMINIETSPIEAVLSLASKDWEALRIGTW